jgi:hypothetical protein
MRSGFAVLPRCSALLCRRRNRRTKNPERRTLNPEPNNGERDDDAARAHHESSPTKARVSVHIRGRLAISW